MDEGDKFFMKIFTSSHMILPEVTLCAGFGWGKIIFFSQWLVWTCVLDSC